MGELFEQELNICSCHLCKCFVHRPGCVVLNRRSPALGKREVKESERNISFYASSDSFCESQSSRYFPADIDSEFGPGLRVLCSSPFPQVADWPMGKYIGHVSTSASMLIERQAAGPGPSTPLRKHRNILRFSFSPFLGFGSSLCSVDADPGPRVSPQPFPK